MVLDVSNSASLKIDDQVKKKLKNQPFSNAYHLTADIFTKSLCGRCFTALKWSLIL